MTKKGFLTMKHLTAWMLIFCITLTLFGCGSKAPAETAPAQTEPATQAEPVTEAPTEAATEAPTETETENDAKATAFSLIDHPVAELYEAIGYPESSDYAPSCLKEGGEDGNLYYDGFIVYTIRVGETETVYYVE